MEKSLKWVDIGINLTNKRFHKDCADVVARASDAGVKKLVITGTSLQESQSAIVLSESDIAKKNGNNLYATAGCHPHDAKSFDNDQLATFGELVKHSNVVALGECGLDFNRNFSTPEQQIKAFKAQLELAVKVQKPVFLHERDAFDTQFEILKDYFPHLKGAVIHCFTGSLNALEQYLSLGLSVGITGWICDERRGKPLFDIVKHIPNSKLMIETDGPYLTPRDLPKKPKDGRNEPMYLPHIAKMVAKARGQTIQQISAFTYNNSCQFFSI